MLKKITNYTIPTENAGEYFNQLAKTDAQKAGEMALQLFCMPSYGRTFSAKEEKILATSEQKRIPVRDFEVQTYRWKGDGQKVLLLHGWDSNATRWRPLISLLTRANYDVLAVDAPAHGKSGNHFAHGVLFAETIGQVTTYFAPDIVIGHSFGGLASTYYFGQLNTNTTLQKLILLGTPSKLTTSITNYHKAIGLEPTAQEAMAKEFLASFDFDYAYFTGSDFIKNIAAKGLIIHDEQDDVTPYEEALDIHAAWENSALYTTQGLGHNLMARSVFKKVMQFCDEH